MPAPKNYIKIKYPRKCERCDYISNNPQMYHYHKRVHEAIPEGTLCNQGCGELAKYTNTKGNHTCEKIPQHCSEYIKEHSARIEKHWENADDRKEQARKTFKERMNTPEIWAQQKKTKREKRNNRALEIKDFTNYSRRAREYSREWAKNQGYKLGVTAYHVDHILSINDAWKLGVPISVVTHPSNLQILWYLENLAKGRQSTHTLPELMEKIFFGETTSVSQE